MHGDFDRLMSTAQPKLEAAPSGSRGLRFSPLHIVIFLAVGLIVVAAALFFATPKPNNGTADYEIFTNLPGEGAELAAYATIRKEGFEPEGFSSVSLLGQIGLNWRLRGVEEVKIGALNYSNGDFGVIAYMRTDALSEAYAFPSFTLGDTETKSIGGNNVTVVYDKYDAEKANPICIWKDGEIVKALFFRTGDSWRVSTGSADHRKCTEILEHKYDSGTAKELLNKTDAMVPIFGSHAVPIADLKVSGRRGATYMMISKDADAMYFMEVSNSSDPSDPGWNICGSYQEPGMGGNIIAAEIVNKDGKSACCRMPVYYMPADRARNFGYESAGYVYDGIACWRRVGNFKIIIGYKSFNHSVMLGSPRSSAGSKLEEMLFSAAVSGQEGNWTDKVYYQIRILGADDKTPIGGAKVALMVNDSLIETQTTDANGEVRFENAPASHAHLNVTKQGYKVREIWFNFDDWNNARDIYLWFE